MEGTTELGRIALRMASADCGREEYAELLPRYLELWDAAQARRTAERNR